MRRSDRKRLEWKIALLRCSLDLYVAVVVTALALMDRCP